MYIILVSFFFFFNDTATTEIYTLSLHDALPISYLSPTAEGYVGNIMMILDLADPARPVEVRSEEHTSELQSHSDLVCRLLLEKKKKKKETSTPRTPSTPYTSDNLAPMLYESSSI